MDAFQIQKDSQQMSAPQASYQNTGHMPPSQQPGPGPTCRNSGLGSVPPVYNGNNMNQGAYDLPSATGKDSNFGLPPSKPVPSYGPAPPTVGTPNYSTDTPGPYNPAYPPMAASRYNNMNIATSPPQPATCQLNEQWWCLIFCWLWIPSIVASFLPLCRAGPRFPDRNYKRGWIGNVIAASVLAVIWIIAIAAGSANGGHGGGGGGGCTTTRSGDGTFCSDGSGFMSASFKDGTSVSTGHRKLLFDVMLGVANRFVQYDTAE